MIPATMLALIWNCKLSTPGLFARGQYLDGGHRDRDVSAGRAFLVDDSWFTGRSLKAAHRLVPEADVGVLYAAKGIAYSSRRGGGPAGATRLFEWNVFHH